MSTFLGISMENWVNIAGDCPMSFELVNRETQIELGHGAGALHLVLTPDALAKLANLTDTALAQLRQQGDA
jgi:hypothetical protein